MKPTRFLIATFSRSVAEQRNACGATEREKKGRHNFIQANIKHLSRFGIVLVHAPTEIDFNQIYPQLAASRSVCMSLNVDERNIFMVCHFWLIVFYLLIS